MKNKIGECPADFGGIYCELYLKAGILNQSTNGRFTNFNLKLAVFFNDHSECFPLTWIWREEKQNLKNSINLLFLNKNFVI